MVVIARKVGRQSFNARRNFQQPVSELIGLKLGNGCIAIRAGNPLGGTTFARRFGWRSERFHTGNIALGDEAAMLFLVGGNYFIPASLSFQIL